jgi:hypothetical protein
MGQDKECDGRRKATHFGTLVQSSIVHCLKGPTVFDEPRKVPQPHGIVDDVQWCFQSVLPTQPCVLTLMAPPSPPPNHPCL